MTMIPDGWCAECNKKALDKIDLAQEDKDTIARLKNAIKLHSAMGGRDTALAEVCFLLDVPMPKKNKDRLELDHGLATTLLREIGNRFGEMIVRFVLNSRHLFHMMQQYVDRNRYMEEQKRRMRERYHDRHYMDSRCEPTIEDMRPPRREYHIPEYRVKENKR